MIEKGADVMFAIVNRLQAIPGFSHGTVVSVHRNELEALIEDAHLRSGCSNADGEDRQTPLFVLPLAVCRKRGEHVRLSDLVDDHSDTQLMPRSLRLYREA
jgi:hypothetical protein